MIMAWGETFVIHPRVKTGVDAYGSDVYGDGEPITVTGAFAPSGSTEVVYGNTMLTQNDTIYLNEGSAVPTQLDRVEARGVLREVDGAPEVYHNPFTGWEPGAVVRLKAVSG